MKKLLILLAVIVPVLAFGQFQISNNAHLPDSASFSSLAVTGNTTISRMLSISRTDTNKSVPYDEEHQSLLIRHKVRPSANDSQMRHFAVDVAMSNDSTNHAADSVCVMTALNVTTTNERGFVEGIESAIFNSGNLDTLGAAKTAWAYGSNFGLVKGFYYGFQGNVDNFAGAYSWGNPFGRILGNTVAVRGRVKNTGHSEDGINFGATAKLASAYSIYSTVENCSENSALAEITNGYGLYYNLSNTGSGASITTHYGIYSGVTNSGSIGTAYGIYIPTPVNTGTLSNYYGLYMPTQVVSGATTNYALYIAGGKSYHFGNLGIGRVPADSVKTIIRADSGKSPLLVEASAGDYAVYVDEEGNVSFGAETTVDEEWYTKGKVGITAKNLDGTDYTAFALNTVNIVDSTGSHYYGGVISNMMYLRDSTDYANGIGGGIVNSSVTGSLHGIDQSVSNENTGSVTSDMTGISLTATNKGQSAATRGGKFIASTMNGGVSVSNAGVYGNAITGQYENGGTASATNQYGGRFGTAALASKGTVTVSNNYGVFVESPTNSGTSTLTNNYGLYVDNQSAGSTNYSIYSNGGNGYHKGNWQTGSFSVGTGGKITQIDSVKTAGGKLRWLKITMGTMTSWVPAYSDTTGKW